MALPKLLAILFIVSFLFAPRVLAQDELENIGTIDESDPSWGEEIKKQTTGGDISVEPQPDQLGFPDLTQFKTDIGEAIPFLLPQDLLDKYKLPEPTPLAGRIFHPVCDVIGGSPEGQGTPSRGVSRVETPSWWIQLLGITKLSQAVAVPGVSSGVEFQIADDVTKLDANEQKHNAFGNCKPPSGESGPPPVAARVSGGTNIVADILAGIFKFLEDIFSREERATVVLQPKKFIAGESEFARQAGEEMGFLRSFCPKELCPKVLNEQEQTPYVDANQVNLEYQGVAGARAGYKLLQDSLYPAELQGVQPQPPPGPLPTKPGAGIFKAVGNPNSEQLGVIITQAGVAFGVPSAVVAAVAWIEGRKMWGLSDSGVNSYSFPGGQWPEQCTPNGCGARGPMQILNNGIASSCGVYTEQIMPDTWNSYKNSVNEATGDNRNPNVCNIKDSIFAGAKIIKDKSGTSKDKTAWTQEEVYRAAGSYVGDPNCNIRWSHLGNKTYCEVVWENYR